MSANDCTATNGRGYHCTLDKNHGGEHVATDRNGGEGHVYARWPNESQRPRITPAESEALAAVLEWREAVRNGRIIDAPEHRLSLAADALAAERAKEPA